MIYLFVSVAVASSPAAPSFEATQSGQDVVVSMNLRNFHMDDPLVLVRAEDGVCTPVFDRVFSSSDATETRSECLSYKKAGEAGDTGGPYDCDGDGEEECVDGYCIDIHRVEVVDPCVPAGSATYTLTWDGWNEETRRTLTVQAVGQDCGLSDDAFDCESGGPAAEDDSGDGEGCGCAATQGSLAGSAVAALGLFALARRRTDLSTRGPASPV